MKREKWIKWKPVEGIPQTLYFRDLKYDFDGLTISLQDRDKDLPMLTIYFKSFFALRIIDEGNKLIDSCDVDEAVLEMELEKGSYYKWSLFTVENSLYLEWFHQESVGVRQNTELIHYVIQTADDVIEVLDIAEIGSPIVTWN